MTLTQLVQVASVVGVLFAVGTVIVTRTIPWFRAKRDSRSLYKRLGTIFIKSQLERTLRYYVPPMCQSIDPSGGEEPRLVLTTREKLFAFLDAVASNPSEYKYIFLLADSGMGKTSALIGYYARHLRRWRRPCKIALVPLGIPDADERISAIEDKEGTFLLLDAFDEDTLAIVDHIERLRILLRATSNFQRVLISCRTQFFARDEEIPSRSGIIKVSARAAGESAEYLFHKVYLSPFSGEDVARYIRRRYPPWKRHSRRTAHLLVKKVPNLSARPMLLAYLDDLMHAGREITRSFELYEAMVEAWLIRERGFVPNPEALRKFSELLAFDLFANAHERGSERIRKEELRALAKEWEIPLDEWMLTGRSLLNRDAEGNWKFAHRSIMEYLLVVQLSRSYKEHIRFRWTDQMTSFLQEMIKAGRVPWEAAMARFILGDEGGSFLDDMLSDLITTPKALALPRFVKLCVNILSFRSSGSLCFAVFMQGDESMKQVAAFAQSSQDEVLVISDKEDGIFIDPQEYYKAGGSLSTSVAVTIAKYVPDFPQWAKGRIESNPVVLNIGYRHRPSYFLISASFGGGMELVDFTERFNSICEQAALDYFPTR